MDPMSIGEKIKALRIEQKMTQKQLAAALSVVDSTISNWEHGRRMPSLAELRRIAEIGQVSLSYFEVFTPTLEQPLPEAMMYKHFQSIELRPKTATMTVANHGLYYGAVVMLVLSFLFMDFVALLFVLVGGFTLTWRFILFYVKALTRQLSAPNRTLVSNENKVYLQNPLEERSIEALRSRLLMVALSMLGLSVLFTVGLNVLAAPHLDLSGLSFLIVFSVGGVAVSLERARALTGPRLIAKQLLYGEAFPFFPHHSLTFSWLYASTVLLVLASLSVVYPLTQSGLWLLILTIVLGAIQALGAYHILRNYRRFTRQLSLIAVTKDHQVIALETP